MEIKIGDLIKTSKEKTFDDNYKVPKDSRGYVLDIKSGNNGKEPLYLIEICGLDEGCPLFAYKLSEIELIK